MYTYQKMFDKSKGYLQFEFRCSKVQKSFYDYLDLTEIDLHLNKNYTWTFSERQGKYHRI